MQIRDTTLSVHDEQIYEAVSYPWPLNGFSSLVEVVRNRITQQKYVIRPNNIFSHFLFIFSVIIESFVG